MHEVEHAPHCLLVALFHCFSFESDQRRGFASSSAVASFFFLSVFAVITLHALQSIPPLKHRHVSTETKTR